MDGVRAARLSFAELYRRGVLATIPALLVSSVFSFLFNRPWALEPIAERVMMLTPVDLSQQLLLRLGTYARPLALFGGFAIAIAIGGLVSVAAGDLQSSGAHRAYANGGPSHGLNKTLAHPWAPTRGASTRQDGRGRSRATRGRALMTVFRLALAPVLLLLALFVVFRPLDALPTGIFAALYIVALLLAAIRCARGQDAREPRVAGALPSGAVERGGVWSAPRRAFLSDSARILGATALLTALLLIEPWYKGLTVHRRGGRLFAFRPVGARRPGYDLAGLTPEITPPSSFYYLSKNLVDPDLSADGWTLRVDGMVSRPVAFTLDDLLALPARNQWVTQECVSNPVGGPLMSCALFTGVSLRRLLLRAGPLAAAGQVVMRAPDGHADSIPVSLAMHPEVLVAYGMDGAYLERAHGYPARILVPGSYGFKSIKWVDHLEVVAQQFKGTWQEMGWTASAMVHTTARIDLARRTADGLLVAGIAFAGARGIRGVQVRIDGGAWVAAILHTPPLSPLTWVQWRTMLPLAAGSRALLLEARAIDGGGAVQESRQSDIYPAGATGYHRITAMV